MRETEPKGSAMRDEFVAADDAAADRAVLRTVPDLRGVPVEDASGLSVGRLWGALAEADTGLLRYIDLDLSSIERHVLVPIGHARVRADESAGPRVRLRAAMLEELEQIPAFPPEVGHIDDPFERSLLEAWGRTFHGERYYAHPSYDHSGLYAGEHPIVADVDDPSAGPLTRLSYLPGWRVATGESDIRGWPLVLEGDGVRLSIRDLIADPGAAKVRYVVIDTPDERGTRLLPVGFLNVDAVAEEVHAPGLMADDVIALPPYQGGGVTRDHEERLRAELHRLLRGRRRYHLPDYRQAGH